LPKKENLVNNTASIQPVAAKKERLNKAPIGGLLEKTDGRRADGKNTAGDKDVSIVPLNAGPEC
jgi:hypothetical protein